MKILGWAAVASATLLCMACSTPPRAGGNSAEPPSVAAPTGKGSRIVKSRDGSFSGEIVGTPTSLDGSSRA